MTKVNWHIGERFSRLLVLAPAGWVGYGKHSYAKLFCVCDCGTFKISMSQSIVNGRTKSCGCMTAENNSRRAAGSMRNAHPGEYNSWAQMRSRCNDPGANGYCYYGGRGIAVCDRWASFDSFLEDMGSRPEGCSIDRIDVNGNYEPGNCQWATIDQQANNRRRTRWLTIDGQTRSLTEWARARSLTPKTVSGRLKRGWSVERALA